MTRRQLLQYGAACAAVVLLPRAARPRRRLDAIPESEVQFYYRLHFMVEDLRDEIRAGVLPILTKYLPAETTGRQAIVESIVEWQMLEWGNRAGWQRAEGHPVEPWDLLVERYWRQRRRALA